MALAAAREGLDDDHAAAAAAAGPRQHAGFVGGRGRGRLGRFRARQHAEQRARPCEVGGASESALSLSFFKINYRKIKY